MRRGPSWAVDNAPGGLNSAKAFRPPNLTVETESRGCARSLDGDDNRSPDDVGTRQRSATDCPPRPRFSFSAGDDEYLDENSENSERGRKDMQGQTRPRGPSRSNSSSGSIDSPVLPLSVSPGMPAPPVRSGLIAPPSPAGSSNGRSPGFGSSLARVPEQGALGVASKSLDGDALSCGMALLGFPESPVDVTDTLA